MIETKKVPGLAALPSWDQQHRWFPMLGPSNKSYLFILCIVIWVYKNRIWRSDLLNSFPLKFTKLIPLENMRDLKKKTQRLADACSQSETELQTQHRRGWEKKVWGFLKSHPTMGFFLIAGCIWRLKNVKKNQAWARRSQWNTEGKARLGRICCWMRGPLFRFNLLWELYFNPIISHFCRLSDWGA